MEDQLAFVAPDGETFTNEDPPPMGPNDALPVATQLFISEVLYKTDDGETKGDEVGRSHIQCTAQVVAPNFRCDGAFRLRRRVPVLASVVLALSTPPCSFDAAVLGGTGDWFGATGSLTHTDISTAEATTTLYEADVVLPHD